MADAWGPSIMLPLMELHSECEKKQVSYSVHFNEHDHTWYVDISSAAPSERFCSRDYSQLSWCIEAALKHLRK